MRVFLFVLSLVIAAGSSTIAHTREQALTVEEVLKLWKTGVPEDLIVTIVKKNAKAFNLNTEEVLALRNDGVSDTVVKFLLDPAQPYNPVAPAAVSPSVVTPQPPPAPAPPLPPPKDYPADAFAGVVPVEPGLYHFPGRAPLKSDVKSLLGENKGAGLGKVLLKKNRAVVYLLGPASKMRIRESAPVIYLRLPEGKAIDEVVLIAFNRQQDRRNIDVGSKLEKQELKPEAMKPFDSLEVGLRLFRVTVPEKFVKGEYAFLLIGSAEPPKGSFGKVFDFGIDQLR